MQRFASRAEVCRGGRARARTLPRPPPRSLCRVHAGSDVGRVFPGRYGNWELTEADALEVAAYRLSLGAAALSADAAALAALFGAEGSLDTALLAFALSLGTALLLVHIYVRPIKQTMQALWLAGALGCAWLAATGEGEPVLLRAATHPWPAVVLAGPLAASLTGLAIKEGLCYGAPESSLLALLVPALCLGRLAGAPDGLEAVLAAACCGAMSLWAARKWVQPVNEDIGDKR